MVVITVVLVPVLLLMLSVDSPCYEIWGRVDSSWYFTAGKAWMNGMVPYVDFSDSKGPLLWLIYGIGYLLSNYNFVGVWLLTCVAYIVTTLINYRTASLFINSKWLSWMVALLMLAVYFNYFIHDETKSEDFCQPLISLSLWVICRLAYSERTLHRFKQGAWMIGLSIGAALMIKFTIAVMIFYFAIMLVVLAWRSDLIGVKEVLWRLLAGALMVCVPFLIMFVFLGNFDDFIREYFIVTSIISSHSPRVNVIGWVLSGGFLSGLIIVMTLSTTAMFLLVKKYEWMPIVAFFWFLLITVQNAEWSYYYYSCMVFGLFGLIVVVKLCEFFLRSKFSKVAIMVLTVVFLGVFSFYKAWQMPNFKPVKQEMTQKFKAKRTEYYRHVNAVKRVNEPRIVFFNCNNIVNVADETGGLPGCKYFAKQFGATDAMIESQYEEIKKKRPHFIYVKKSERESLEKIEQLGYFHLLEPGEIIKVYLLAAPELMDLYR
ncbi:MAG: glycosyltransferase family 39 protein [Muribaculaceae bacterium]|nr:glycosyltransferase family 39 protein [Muribaculaceae bacterium]